MTYMYNFNRRYQFLKEGGFVGHLPHLVDNPDLTFAEIKEVINNAAEGKLERVSEKIDGMNLVFTFDVSTNELKVARNSGDIKSGGMDAASLAKKFYGRGNIEDAFNNAFRILNKAFNSMSTETLTQVFGETGDRWYSMEIVYTPNTNVIKYDTNNIVFHAWPVFDIHDDGSVEQSDDDSGVDLLTSKIEQMQKAVSEKDWQLHGPAFISLKKIADGTIVSKAISAVDAAMSVAGVSDNDTIRDYTRNLMSEQVAELGLKQNAATAVVERSIGASGAPSVNDIKKMVLDKNKHQVISNFVKNSEQLVKQFIQPLERAITSFAVEVLRGISSVLVKNSDKEVERLRSQVTKVLDAANKSGNPAALEFVEKEMQRLGSVKNISAAMEGIVFSYKGKTYKFVGSFSPMNQILGLFRYGRKDVPQMNIESYSRICDRLLNESVQQSSSRSVLQNIIRLMLEAEGDDKEDVWAAATKQDREQALKRYEAAKAALSAWEANDVKKKAYDLEFVKLRKKGMGEEKARKLLLADPAYAYNTPLAAKKRETLEAELERAELDAANFDPSIRDYKRELKGGAKSTADKKMPEKGKRAFKDINKTPAMVWLPWITQLKRSNIPYGAHSSDDEKGIGG